MILSETIRHLLYPLGFLATFFFFSRFILQWLLSEKKKLSHVTKGFWIFSLFGNALMAIHGLIQGQFPVAFLQAFNGSIAWRNLDLMRKTPLTFRRSFPLMLIVPLSCALFWFYMGNSEWMHGAPSVKRVSLLWHVIGTLGMLGFASRFWIQWWNAENARKSILGKTFWLISILGSGLSLAYFLRLKDPVNILSYGVGLIPYLRNLMLMKKTSAKPLQKDLIFLFAGEQSGDLLGGELLLALKQSNPETRFYGVGGKEMIAQGLKALLTLEAFHVMGFYEVLKSLPRLIKNFRKIKKQILEDRPELVILIDYPDFNMRLAAALRKGGYKGKLIHYVSPSVWAWRKNRTLSMAKNLDLLLTILPFEKQCYQHTALDVTYVGHPLVKVVDTYPRKALDFSAKGKLLAIFPGSRAQEIARNLKIQLETAQRFQDYTIAISCAREELREEIEKIASTSGCRANIVSHEFRYDLMRECDVALATSGTVTLELALHEAPTVVTYQLSFFNYFVGRYFFRIRLPYFTLTNIILNKRVFPEFIHRKLGAQEIADSLQQMIDDRERCKEECLRVRHALQALDASEEAARAIRNLCDRKIGN